MIINSGISYDNMGNLYIVSSTGDLHDNKDKAIKSSDIMLIKIDIDGNKEWTKILGTPYEDAVRGLTIDHSSNNIFVFGETMGQFSNNINQGCFDIFLVQFDSNGNKLYSYMAGTVEDDYARGIVSDDNGNIYITGETEWKFDHNKHYGGDDAFIIKFKPKKFSKKQGGIEWNYMLKLLLLFFVYFY